MNDAEGRDVTILHFGGKNIIEVALEVVRTAEIPKNIPKSRLIALARLCKAELGNNDIFNAREELLGDIA